MALCALDRAFVPDRMAGDAESMSSLFTPIIDLADLGGVALKALVIQDLLVLPVHKRKNQVSHFEFDNFRAKVRWSSRESRDSPPNQRQQKKC
jgi:hypothetical protein